MPIRVRRCRWRAKLQLGAPRSSRSFYNRMVRCGYPTDAPARVEEQVSPNQAEGQLESQPPPALPLQSPSVPGEPLGSP